MSEQFGNFFVKPPPGQGGAVKSKPAIQPPSRVQPAARKPVFSKAFRWRKPNEQTPDPAVVEVAGTFTKWQKVPLARNGAPDAWQVTLHDIPAHRTHHYMLLVDGQPVYDPGNDGLAAPAGPEETRFQLMTDRGPRVFMLFAQSK